MGKKKFHYLDVQVVACYCAETVKNYGSGCEKHKTKIKLQMGLIQARPKISHEKLRQSKAANKKGETSPSIVTCSRPCQKIQ